MRLFSIIFIFILNLPLIGSTQNGNWLRVKMQDADTVLLDSHEVTAGVGIVDSLGNLIPLQKLVVSGRPYVGIIKEQQIITGAQLDSFIKILARPFADRLIETGKYFMPNHAVFLIKNGITSYIDICFGCRDFDTSKDLQRLYAFDNRKWVELESYFVKIGFKYVIQFQNARALSSAVPETLGHCKSRY